VRLWKGQNAIDQVRTLKPDLVICEISRAPLEAIDNTILGMVNTKSGCVTRVPVATFEPKPYLGFSLTPNEGLLMIFI
jgi:hypothetical protein